MENDQQSDSVPTRSFDEVLREELASIDSIRPRRDPQRYREVDPSDAPGNGDPQRVLKHARDRQLVGLAFSGGGIRSATFNLGVLQGLAKLRLLGMFDYLSTVSGGGYIGSWLAAWIKRSGLEAVTARLHPYRATIDSFEEPRQIRFLREYSNYLTPKLGWFGADTWTTVAIYLRNLILNLLILVAALSVMVVAPHGVATLFKLGHDETSPLVVYIGAAAAIVLLIAVSYAIGLNYRSFARNLFADTDRSGKKKNQAADPPSSASSDSAYPLFTRQESVQKRIVLPLVLASMIYTKLLWKFTALDWYDYVTLTTIGHFLCCALVFFVAMRGKRIEGPGGTDAKSSSGDPVSWKAILISTPIAGAIGGLLHYRISALFQEWSAVGEFMHPTWPVTVWGTPMVLISFCLMWILHMGLVGRGLPDEIREWWSRLIAWLLIYSLVWIVLFGIAVYGPPIIVGFTSWIQATLTWGWIGSTVLSIIAGRSATTGAAEKPNRALELIAKVGPYIFIIGLLGFLSVAVHQHLLSRGISISVPDDVHIPFTDLVPIYWNSVNREILLHPERLWVMGILIVVAVVLSWRVDVNQFSMHLYYRNRLTRCYLGASNCDERDPQPFTGFAPTDDLSLCELSDPDHDSSKPRKHRRTTEPRPYDGPYPIINATLNLVGGDDLAWQERKAAPFIFTPKFCGYVIPPTRSHGVMKSKKLADHAYCSTHDYAASTGFISLGTAMSISGAAASPNMGYHTSTPLAFLLTLFNVRLGWWLGNPRRIDGWNQSGPRLVLLYLLSELFALTNDKRRYIYLSDGGHFENLGIYELVRRRCRFIIACDAGQDGDFKFADLGNAIEKCRSDLGVDIEIDVEPIRRRNEQGHSQWHCAIGRIRYNRVDHDAPDGTLVYIKTSLTGNEPTDVLRYAATNPPFPHQSTADQWFDESQFESYRALGQHIIEEVIGSVRDEDTGIREANNGPKVQTAEDLFLKLRERWYPPSPGTEAAFSRHTSVLDKIQERIRNDETLGFLNEDVYPEWNTLMRIAGVVRPSASVVRLPKTEKELRNGFYICLAMIQLMEDVYLDLNMEEEYDHPDNRGWINLFMHWTWSGMFRTTWTITASTYGARFQTFCERRLGLTIGSISLEKIDLRKSPGADPEASLRDAFERGDINFVERGMIEICLKFNAVHTLVLFQITPDGFATDAVKSGDKAPTFTFGFALLEENDIVYLRVQDHLRRMGLARRGLTQLVRESAATGQRIGSRPIRIGDMPKGALELPTEEDRSGFERLFKSVCYETGGCRNQSSSTRSTTPRA